MSHKIGKNNERNRKNRKSKIEQKYATYRVVVPQKATKRTKGK
jgi:hypothetical protein